MAKDAQRWTLVDVIDFENEIGAAPATPPELRNLVVSRSRGLDGTVARRVGLKVWLDGVRSESTGAKFMGALGLVGSLLALAMFAAGFSGVLGMVDRARAGVHVTLFLAILIGGQWLLLALAAVAWLVRRRAAEGFSMVQALAGRLARRIAGEKEAPWWGRVMHGDAHARAALLWRLGRMTQAAAVCFNLGIIAGLAGLVMVRHVGFFWETTTEVAMHDLLGNLTRFLSAPGRRGGRARCRTPW
jgi:hypothetical protein